MVAGAEILFKLAAVVVLLLDPVRVFSIDKPGLRPCKPFDFSMSALFLLFRIISCSDILFVAVTKELR
jgi:hypothetical protein